MSRSDVALETPVQARTEAPEARPAAFGFQNVVGQSPSIRRAVALGVKVAEHPTTTVLIHGATGTGKELVARGIHYASTNAGEPFVAINCSAIPENLLESELFGHEKGAFTDAHTQKRGLLELAGRGTVFLDEISELPPNLQPKLLRVLEEKRVRRLGGLEEREIACRVIAATNRDLAQAVAEGHFREDLFYRLNVFRIELPHLRSRGDDIDNLARYFAETICREQGLPPKHLTVEALVVLREHGWPGNIRELKNAIERAIILSDKDRIEPAHIMIQQRSSVPAAVAAESRQVAGTIRIPSQGITLDEVERQLIAVTLQLADNNQTLAARMLGISRPTVIRKIRKYRLQE
ncbi:MAG: sigma-54-dependent Fis family transcriptional regulator [Gemmatimonadetes bacterium]|nr:sigma-54-dependent Fis family transcriptional regulator [Gemmatimonadota bacterium]